MKSTKVQTLGEVETHACIYTLCVLLIDGLGYFY